MIGEFESAKEGIGKSILLNSFDVNKRVLVVTEASGDRFGNILLQQKKDGSLEARAQVLGKSGELEKDTGWVVIQVGSAALKPAWRNYSDLELNATYFVWTLETLAYYLKGCLA